MKKEQVFTGVATALITPFRNGEIDYAMLSDLIEWQIESGIDALVIGGTTGEAATLQTKERYCLYEKTHDYVNGRVKLIFGTGTNDTVVACAHTEMASDIGCDGVLVVTPYYNKGTREGLARHYEKIAEASRVPIILYNVPSRTGTNLDLALLKRLAKLERVVGIKEASDSADRMLALSKQGSNLWLYAGNDSQIYGTLALGGLGVISVVSNLYPKQVMEITKQYFAGNEAEARRAQMALLPVIDALFLETNPAPIKYAMSLRGLCTAEMRLPMWLPTRANRKRIERALENYEKLC